MSESLDRRLGLIGSAAVGMSAMLGAGLFVVFGPATQASGDGIFIALGIAAAIAMCNAFSSARLARLHPIAGGTYVFGRERLGPFWGHLAGWSFVAGKLASCAAMALALGTYVWPDQAQLVAVCLVALVTLVNLTGVEKSATLSTVIVVLVLSVVLTAIAVMWSSDSSTSGDLPTAGPRGILGAAGLLFFAFAGYARLATLGEEVRDPERTIGRAMAIAVILIVAVYAASAAALLHVLGADGLSASARPFVDGLNVVGADAAVAAIVAAAALAAGGALLSLTLGVSRTVLAMARDGYLPRPLARIDPRRRVPHIAEVTVAVVVSALVTLGDLTSSIAFSSFCVLTYYAITNAAALTVRSSVGAQFIAVLGLGGCLLLAAFIGTSTLLIGCMVVAMGAVSFAVASSRSRPRRHDERRPPP